MTGKFESDIVCYEVSLSISVRPIHSSLSYSFLWALLASQRNARSLQKNKTALLQTAWKQHRLALASFLRVYRGTVHDIAS